MKKALLLLSVVTASACAKVGDPLPPLVQVPETTTQFDVWQIGDETLQLVFPLPPSPVTSVEVFRGCGEGDEAALDRVDETAVRELTPLDSLRYSQILPNQPGLDSCTYGLRFRGSGGLRSAFSNLVQVQPTRAPDPPIGLRAQVSQDEIVLHWEPPSAGPAPVIGFLVNRSVFVTSNEYRTREFEFGKPISFRVQAVSRLERPGVFSGDEAIVTLTPEDTFAPPSPTKLRAIAAGEGIQLIWDAIPDRDLLGYYVYRRSGTAEWTRVSALVAVNRYFDSPGSAGAAFEYAVSAVDQSSNESPLSDTAAVRLEP